MRATNHLPRASGHAHPNPLASHAPADMNGSAMAPPRQPLQHSPVAASSRPSTAVAVTASPTSSVEDQPPLARPALTRPQSARPSFARAKSDFGPRHPAVPPESTDAASVDGQFKIRHGWDDQLNSEEYSNLLTSVRLPAACWPAYAP
jgi:regulator-associated protein of mTOR